MEKKKLVLVDGNAVVYMGYHALATSGLTNSEGFPTNAIYNFINFVTTLKSKYPHDYIAFAFDIGKKTFRHEFYTDYKTGRKPTPDDLKQQFPVIKKYLDILNISYFEQMNYEADDIVATIAKMAQPKYKVDIFSRDRDLLQLATDDITVHMMKKGLSEVEDYTEENFVEKMGITPLQMIDFKAISGDSSDAIKGIPGVGPKTATKWINEFETLENIIENADKLRGKNKDLVPTIADELLMYKKIIKLSDDVMIPLDDIENLKCKEPNEERLIEFYKQYEFNRFLKQLKTNKANEMKLDFKTIDNPAIFIDKINNSCAIHLEVYGDNYHHADIIGVAITTENETVYFDATKENLIELEKLLANTKIEKYVYDYKKQKVALKYKNVEFTDCNFDIKLADYLIDPDKAKKSIDLVASSNDYYLCKSDEEIYGKGAKKAIPNGEVLSMHVASKANAIWNTRTQILDELKKRELLNLYQEMEHPLMNVLANMELEGIKVDVEYLEKLKKEFAEKIADYTTKIFEVAGQEFNISSPKQLGIILFDVLKLPSGKKTKSGQYSTSAEVLENLKNEHPVVETVLNYRQITKLQSTYVEGLLSLQQDGMIHTIFNQTETATGRLSSIEPNLQNISVRSEEGKKIRKAFIPNDKENKLLAADYSQIELRILAHVSENKTLIEAFNNDVDIHTQTASAVFGVPFEEVTSLQRSHAKAVNFGIIYGMSGFGLAKQLGISPKEADDFIKKYFETFDGIKSYQDELLKQATFDGYVKTLFGRVRYLPDLRQKNFQRKELAKRAAINAPIQGGSQDIIKKAMINIDKYLKETNKKSKLVVQVHDELVFDVVPEELSQLSVDIPKLMHDAVTLKVELKVEASIGENWLEAK